MSTDTPELRHGYADLSEVRLHYVEAGEGPLVVLLHGFPEFWYSWRAQIPALAAAGFRVVAPDMRGYNLSSRLEGVGAYGMPHLTGDVRELIAERGAQRALLAGHDWGGSVAWATAIGHPEVVERLAILNVPHPRRLLQGLRTPRQLRKSWYIFFFQLPELPERLVSRNRWQGFRDNFEHDARPGAFSAADIERYVEAWSRPGAITAMINYYRGAVRQAPQRAVAGIAPITAPTLVIWGERDRHLGAELAEPEHRDVPQLEGVERLDASHWVQHDQPEAVNRLLTEFFSAS
jgi:pimeloyl-ACP methyl ester carboxylesterase